MSSDHQGDQHQRRPATKMAYVHPSRAGYVPEPRDNHESKRRHYSDEEQEDSRDYRRREDRRTSRASPSYEAAPTSSRPPVPPRDLPPPPPDGSMNFFEACVTLCNAILSGLYLVLTSSCF